MKLPDFARVPRQPYVQWWSDCYGTDPALFEGYDFYQRGRNNVWVATDTLVVEGLGSCDGVGLPFVRLGGHLWKPTSVAIQHFGATARRNVLDLTDSEAIEVLARRRLEFAGDDPRAGRMRGFIVARLAGVPIACLEWRHGGADSCVPKGRAIDPVDLPRRSVER